MLFADLRRLTATLRFRLVAWMVLVTIALVTVTMVAVHQVFSRALQEEFDQTLRADIIGVSLEFKQHYPDWRRLGDALDRRALGHPLQAWFAEVFDEQGRLLCFGGLRTDTLPTPTPMPTSGGLRAMVAGEHRMLMAPLDVPDLPPHFVRLGGRVQTLEDDLALLNESMILRGIILLILAPVGGYIIALRATRPMAWINATAARLQPARLDERLPIRGAGDELDDLSHTINHLLDRIANYIDRNREFVANAAHELRSPLAAIRSSVEVALGRGRSQEEYDALLSEIMEQCGQLSSLVNRLLILAEGDAGRLTAPTQAARLDKLVRESVAMFEGVAEAQGVQLEIVACPPVSVGSDEFYLRQVVRNLIDNAIKFSPPPGMVTIELSVAEARRQAVLRISDRGMGIPASDLPHVFDRFFRGDKARRREPGQGGSGLGLSICQTIVQALGGTISVDSQPGQGSTFTVTLPLAAETNPTTLSRSA